MKPKMGREGGDGRIAMNVVTGINEKDKQCNIT
jgi:hypothetical protein